MYLLRFSLRGDLAQHQIELNQKEQAVFQVYPRRRQVTASKHANYIHKSDKNMNFTLTSCCAA